MAKNVVFEIDTDIGELTIQSGTLFLGEQTPIAFSGYTPASGNHLFLSLFDKDRRTPLADNATSSAILDLRYAILRTAFHECQNAHAFYATVIERTATGDWVGEVLAAGHVYVQWSPVAFDAVSGAPATLKGDKGDTGDQGPAGADGATGPAGPSNTLTIGTVTDGNAAAATITGSSPNQVLNLTLPRGQQGLPGLQGATGPAGADGSDGADGADGVSPTVAVTRNASSVLIEITDATGTHSASVYDGATGATGPQGPQGPQGVQGEKGNKGDTGATGPSGPQGVSGVYVGVDPCPAGYNVQIDTTGTCDYDPVEKSMDMTQPVGRDADGRLWTTSSAGGVLPFPTRADFPATGEYGKIYLALDTNTTYTWNGTDYVAMDNVIRYPSRSDFPATGEAGKLYLAMDTSLMYTWTGADYVQLGQSVVPYTSRAAFPSTGQTGKIYLANDTVQTWVWDVATSTYVHTHCDILPTMRPSPAYDKEVYKGSDGKLWTSPGEVNVVEAANKSAFPSTGSARTIYLSKDTSFAYYWNSGYKLINALKVCTSLPASGETGCLYYRTDLKETHYWDGTTYVRIAISIFPSSTAATTNMSEVYLFTDGKLYKYDEIIRVATLPASDIDATKIYFRTTDGSFWRRSASTWKLCAWNAETGNHPTTVSGYGITDARIDTVNKKITLGTNAVSGTEVELEVLDKNDVIDNVSSTFTQKPLSANQGKFLNDSLIAPAYDATKTYALNARVVHDGLVWICTVPAASPEVWTQEHWRKMTASTQDFQTMTELPNTATGAEMRTQMNNILKLLKGQTLSIILGLLSFLPAFGADVYTQQWDSIKGNDPVVTNVTFTGLALTNDLYDVQTNLLEAISNETLRAIGVETNKQDLLVFGTNDEGKVLGVLSNKLEWVEGGTGTDTIILNGADTMITGPYVIPQGYGEVNQVLKSNGPGNAPGWTTWSGLTSADVINATNSTETAKPLSANIGRLLNEGKVNRAGDTMSGNLGFSQTYARIGGSQSLDMMSQLDSLMHSYIWLSKTGEAQIRAGDGTTVKDLYMKSDGTCMWNGRYVCTAADANTGWETLQNGAGVTGTIQARIHNGWVIIIGNAVGYSGTDSIFYPCVNIPAKFQNNSHGEVKGIMCSSYGQEFYAMCWMGYNADTIACWRTGDLPASNGRMFIMFPRAE